MNKEILVWINNQIKSRTSLLSRINKPRGLIGINPESIKADLKILNQIKKELEENDIKNYAKLKCEPAPVLDVVEKRYLKNVIRPFKDRIIYVKKLQSTAYRKIAYLYVAVKDDSYMMFPRFNKNTMYKNMKINKEYTLEELGIEYE